MQKTLASRMHPNGTLTCIWQGYTSCYYIAYATDQSFKECSSKPAKPSLRRPEQDSAETRACLCHSVSFIKDEQLEGRAGVPCHRLTHRGCSKGLDLLPDHIDASLITGIQLLHPCLCQLRPAHRKISSYALDTEQTQQGAKRAAVSQWGKAADADRKCAGCTGARCCHGDDSHNAMFAEKDLLGCWREGVQAHPYNCLANARAVDVFPVPGGP